MRRRSSAASRRSWLRPGRTRTRTSPKRSSRSSRRYVVPLAKVESMADKYRFWRNTKPRAWKTKRSKRMSCERQKRLSGARQNEVAQQVEQLPRAVREGERRKAVERVGSMTMTRKKRRRMIAVGKRALPLGRPSRRRLRHGEEVSLPLCVLNSAW